MQTRILAALLPLVFSIGAGTLIAAPSGSLDLEVTQEPTAWTVLYQHQKVLVYSFAPQKYKPYVKELSPLGGENILLDAPSDHLHHHGLMYAIRINGLNFWEELSGFGVEKPVQTAPPVLGSIQHGGAALPQAKLTQLIHWLAPQDAFLPNTASVALLVEQRTLTLTIDPTSKEVALEWKSQFEVGTRTNTVTLTGSNYNGLGVRFLRSLDPFAMHSLAGTQPDLTKNRQDVTAGPWAAVSFNAPGKPATIVLTGHPSNARGDATFFSMLTPFSYLAATQALNKEPLVYHTGDKFELNYLVLVYPALTSPDDIGKRVQSWKEQKP